MWDFTKTLGEALQKAKDEINRLDNTFATHEDSDDHPTHPPAQAGQEFVDLSGLLASSGKQRPYSSSSSSNMVMKTM